MILFLGKVEIGITRIILANPSRQGLIISNLFIRDTILYLELYLIVLYYLVQLLLLADCYRFSYFVQSVINLPLIYCVSV